jgi:hypothetical protein
MSRKKSDENKIKEGYGTGRGKNYQPFIKVHEPGKDGRTHRIFGWKTNRIHQLLSDLELYFFLESQWDDNFVDIREQYPLLPISDTMLIAKNLGIRHPSIKNKYGEEIVMTTDFVLTVKKDKLIKDIVRTVKPQNKLNKRTIDKFRIEKEYFSQKGITDWGIVTENEINKTKAQNIYFLYQSYFWGKRNNLTNYELNKNIYDFSNVLIKNDYRVLETAEEFTVHKNWPEGEGLVFFKYLLSHKIIETDLNIPLNFRGIKVWFKEEKDVFS